MKIELPATLTARYDPDPWTEDHYETNGTGTIYIEFGGWPVLSVRIEENGERFTDDGSYYRSANSANEALSEFVAEWLKKIFTNALAVQ